MSAVIVLLALSALIGFALGRSFSVFAIAAASVGIAIVSSATLQMQGFGAVSGIAIVVICLTLSQVAYLAAGWWRHQHLLDKKTDEEPRDRREHDVGSNQYRQQKAPSGFA